MASSRHRAAPAAHQEQRHRTEPEAAPRLPTQLPTKAANEPETACGKISLTLNIWVPWLLSKGTQTGKIMAGWIALFLPSYSRKFLTPPNFSVPIWNIYVFMYAFFCPVLLMKWNEPSCFISKNSFCTLPLAPKVWDVVGLFVTIIDTVVVNCRRVFSRNEVPALLELSWGA